MWRSVRALLLLAAEMNPGAQSDTTVIGPGCLIGVVSWIKPSTRSSVFSDGTILDAISDVKWSITSNISWPDLFMMSAWK